MMAVALGKQDLGKRVEESIARFDQAVRESTLQDDKQLGSQLLGDQQLLTDLLVSADLSPNARGIYKSKGKPRCRPWSYEDFTERLRTFTPLGWFAKPSFASPSWCARFGWVNERRDLLLCPCCGAQLMFSKDGCKDQTIDEQSPGESGAESHSSTSAAESFSSLLTSKHHDLCPWKGNPCPLDFLYLPPRASGDWRRDFLERFRSLLSLAKSTRLPEPSVPSSLRGCHPGGLEDFFRKARLLLAEEEGASSRSSPAPPAAPSGAAHTPSPPSAQGIRSPANVRPILLEATEAGLKSSDGSSSKRKEHGRNEIDEVDATCASVDGSDEATVDAAALLALFGWRSASSDGVGQGSEGRSPGGGEKRRGKDAPEGSLLESFKQRLCCSLCFRRVLPDNFLPVEPVGGEGKGKGKGKGYGDSGPCVDGGGGAPPKKRRLSGGGTPLKPMDVVGEHRSFCPWAVIHPAVEGEVPEETVMPGWRHTLEAIVGRDRATSSVLGSPGNPSGPSDEVAGSGGARDVLGDVQKVLGVLMRY